MHGGQMNLVKKEIGLLVKLMILQKANTTANLVVSNMIGQHTLTKEKSKHLNLKIVFIKQKMLKAA